MENMGEYVESRDWGAEIGKIKKGDKVLVNIISEPLQEHYNLIMQKREDFNERVEKLKVLYATPDMMSIEEAREIHLMNYEVEKTRGEFWIKVNDQYKLWKTGAVGIRNGYCLVKTISPEDFMNRLKGFMDEMMEEMNGNDD